MDEATLLLGFIAIQRMAELILARHNTRRLLASGATEHGRAHYPLVVAFHATWLAGLWIIGRNRMVDPFGLTAFVALQLVRLWILATLRDRWTTRVIVVAGAPLVTGGPYRFVRHPNYAVVAGEVAVVPLALGLPAYAAVFTLLHVPLLLTRIRVENRALAAAAPVRPKSL
jgi:methyltransferase